VPDSTRVCASSASGVRLKLHRMRISTSYAACLILNKVSFEAYGGHVVGNLLKNGMTKLKFYAVVLTLFNLTL
jgi:ABC-type lipopolysaccharide export system ATPase subunit